jgi:predicted metal-dependent HD superfamily phosphohydrolase
MEAVKEIVKFEKVDDTELVLLLTAAAYHDCGFLTTYLDHEAAGCVIARETLPEFGFNSKAIARIEEMIMATKVPQQPTTRLARILCDADLDYLGGGEYTEIASRLYQELSENGFYLTEDRWLLTQIEFLNAHQFWTDFAMEHRNPAKQEVLKSLESEEAKST